MTVEESLREETEKWTKKINSELENVETYGTKGKEMLRNIKAYVEDSAHFRKQGDPVRAFEAIVWAWAWLEIGRDMKFIAKEYVDIRKIGR